MPSTITPPAAATLRREARARRLAKRQGFAVRKSRVRNPHLNDQGGYMVINPSYNLIVAGERFNLDLDDVEEFLGRR